MNIPVARPFFGEAEEAAVIQVLRSGWVTQGPRVAEFEAAFAGYVGAAHAVAVSSCTTALHLSLYALGVGPGEEVVCPSFSFIATANSIVHCGATPVFVDIDPQTYNLDPALVDSAITSRTKAIMPVHQVGMPAPMQEIMEIASRHRLLVVEDAACATGSEYQHHRIGKPFGQVVCFSFHPRKILTTGDGGMITTDDPDLASRLKRLRQHAMSVPDTVRHASNQIITETYDEVGYNYRMTDIQAAVGIEQLKRLPEFLQKRREQARRYTQAFFREDKLQPPVVPDYANPNFQSYLLRLKSYDRDKRDLLMQRLLEKGISTRRGIMSCHLEKPYAENGRHWHLPASELASDQTLVLPLHHAMTEEQQKYVIASVLGAVDSI